MVELYLHSPICLHGIMLNELSTGTTLPYMNCLLRSVKSLLSGGIVVRVMEKIETVDLWGSLVETETC
jgi:hypothetical protein